MIITEDFVSFETAKLLKEKGFDEPVLKFYDHKGEIAELYYRPQNKSLTGDTYKCPTLQMVMKWLREEKEIFISICGCTYPQERKVTWIPEISTFDSVFPDSAIEYETYEEAAEEAIKYCLENFETEE